MDKKDPPGSPRAGSAKAGKAAGHSEASCTRVSPAGSSRKGLADTARFWEPRRLLYNRLRAGLILVA